MLDIMNNLTKTAIVGTALTVGLSTYDEMTPPAATYFRRRPIPASLNVLPSTPRSFGPALIPRPSPSTQVHRTPPASSSLASTAAPT